MGKIKVSKEVALALNTALKTVSKETLLNDHATKLQWHLDVYLPLNELTPWQMAQILINGYEVEQTPEEKLLALYKKLFMFGEQQEVDGIKKTLEILKIKIKGIND